MSRCFPFPPRGYTGKCSSNEALIVSIKLQSERENAISDREQQKVKSSDKKVKSSDKKKDRIREKKEKKEKKDKHRVHSGICSEKEKYIDKLCKAGGLLDDSESNKSLLKQELLEQSNLTEEHGRPVESHNVSCSSDSTGNSGKRKRHSSPPSSIQGNGNIIRIRLSTQKRDDSCTSGSTPIRSEDHHSMQGKVRSGSTLERADLSISQKNGMSSVQESDPAASMTMSTATLQLVSREDTVPCPSRQRESVSILPMEVPSTSGKIETKEPSKKLSSHERKMLKRESLYNSLFQNFVAPTLHNDLVIDQDDDEEWLFGKKDAEGSAKRLRSSDDLQASVDNLPCSASAVMQPQAHFLADVGVHALPFTVPF